jgi:hypothetical protein
MSRETILEAQEFLTIDHNDRSRKIVDIGTLLKNHPAWRVKAFLNQMFKERQKILRELISKDKTSHKVDETIARMFRLNMAIKTIEKEVIT